MNSSNQNLTEVYGLLVKNIKECEPFKKIDLPSLLNGIDVQKDLNDFVNQFFSQKGLPLKFGKPVLSTEKVSFSLIDISLLNASDVTFELAFSQNEQKKIDTSLALTSKTGVNLADLASVLSASGIELSNPALPPEYGFIGSISLSKFSIAFDSQLTITNVAFDVKSKKAWQIPDLDKFCFSSELDISIDYPLTSGKQKISGKLTGKQDLGDKGAIFLEAGLKDDFNMQLKAEKMKLTELVELCAGELPSVLPETTASLDLSLKWLKKTKKWEVKFDVTADTSWDVDGKKLEVELTLDYERKASEKGEMQSGGSVELTAKNTIPVNDNISLKKLEFELKKEKDKEKWVMDGGITLGLFGADFALKAGYEGGAKSQTITLSSTQKEGKIEIPGLTGVAVKDFKFELEWGKKEKSSSISGELKASMELPSSAELAVTSKVSKEKLELKVSAKEISLSKISKALAIELPEIIPDIELETEFDVTKDKKGWSFDFDFTAKAEWKYEQETLTTDATVKLTSKADEKEQKTYGSISFTADNTFKLIDELQLKQFKVSLSKEKEEKWTASSDSKLLLFEKEFDLGVEYTYDNKQTLKFYAKSIDAIDLLPNVVYLKPAKVELSVTKKEKETKWELSSDGELKIVDVFTLGGKLKLGSKGLSYEPDKSQASVDLKIPIPPAESLNLKLSLDSLAIEKEKTDTAGSSSWSLSAQSTITVEGLPKFFDDFGIAKGQKIKFSANSKGVGLEFKDALLDTKVKLPDIQLEEGYKIELSKLGEFRFKFADLSVKLGKEISVGIVMGVAAPDELNNIFGVDAKGNPVHKYFVTSSEGTVDFKFKLGYLFKSKSFGAEFQLQSSPFTMIKLEDPKGKDADDDSKVWNCDFGDIGKISFTIPSFTLDTNGFGVKNCQASGLKKLAIPLKPIKHLLKEIIKTSDHVVDLLPDKVPLSNIQVLDEKDNFVPAKLIEQLEKAGFPVTKEVKDALDLIKGEVDRLPAELKNYFKSSIPNSFKVEISISLSTIQIDAEVSDPVRMIYPSMFAGIPLLQGITFRKFSLGMLFGGQMFKTKIDADFNQFDLISLAAGLLIPKGSWIPICHDFNRKIIIDNLLMYIPIINIEGIPIPIPIPIFYDQLGVEYMGIEGVGVQAHAEFPEPEFDLLFTLKFLLSAIDFLTTPEGKLKQIPPKKDLVFSLDNCYAELPRYIINKENPEQRRYGGLGKFLKISGNDLIDMFNTIKFMKLSDLVNAIPEEFRKGEIKGQVDFLGLNFDVAWNIHSNSSLMRQLLSLQNAKSNNVAVMLKGNAKSKIASIDGSFLLISDSAKGFLSGYKFEGNLFEGNVLRINMSGDMLVDKTPSGPVVKLRDKSSILFFNKNVFSQDFECEYNQNGLVLDGKFQLFEDRSLVQAKGKMKGHFTKSEIKLDGDASLTIAGLNLVSFNGHLTEKGFSFDGYYLGTTFSVVAVDEANRYTRLHGTMNLLGATVDLKADVDRNNISDSSFVYFYDLPNLLRVDAQMKPIGSGGTFNAKYIGLPFIDGKLLIAENLVKFDGRMDFPAKDFIVGLFSDVAGKVDSSGIYYSGTGSFRLGVMALTGYTIEIRPNSFTASGIFLGSGLALNVSVSESHYLIIAGTVTLIGCPLELKVKIDSLSLTNNSLYIKYSIPLVLELSGTMAPVGQEGSFDLSLFGIKLTSTKINITTTGFSMRGNLQLGLLNFGLSGQIDQRGLYLSGSVSFGIPNIIEFKVTIIINNGAPGVVISLPGGVEIQGMICVYRGQLSLLFSFGLYYYWINSTINYQKGRPSDWPMHTAVSDEERRLIARLSDKSQPRYRLEEVLETAVAVYNGWNHEEVEKQLGEKFCASLYDYKAVYSCIPDGTKEKFTDWALTFYRPAGEDLFFTPLIERYTKKKGIQVAECELNHIERMECRFTFDGTSVSKIEVIIYFESSITKPEVQLELSPSVLNQMKEKLIDKFIEKGIN